MAYVSWPAMMGIEDAGNTEVFLARGLFESAQDLDCRFYSKERPHLVTDILHRCLRPSDHEAYDPDELWAWTLPKRLQGLLAVAIASGQSSVETVERCLLCNEDAELGLELSSFMNASLDNILMIEPEPGVCLEVEVPTGRHQLDWLLTEVVQADEDNGLAMAATLIKKINGEAPNKHWQMPAHWLDKTSMVLEEHDTLNGLNLPISCPSCSQTMQVELDLEKLLLIKLVSQQKALLEEVFYLAKAYHWTETEIFRLPAWRRSFYVRRYKLEMQ